MNRKLLVDYVEVRNLFNEEFKQTMQLIQDGETHLDNLAEGFTEADRVLFRLMLRRQTNADRIRAMSDEELSVWLIRLHTICECCAVSEECETMKRDVVCRQHIEEWLRQPVKDGEGGD